MRLYFGEDVFPVHAVDYQHPVISSQHLTVNSVNQNSVMSSLAQRMVEAREEAELTQTELAKKSGCGQSLVGNLESGNQKTSSKLPSIAAALGVEALWLAEGKGPKRKGDAIPMVSLPKKPDYPPGVDELIKIVSAMDTIGVGMVIAEAERIAAARAKKPKTA